MSLINENQINSQIIDYVIVGAGPAGICALPHILNSGVAGEHIVWIDPHFKVGDFGSLLSAGSSVPGNTTVVSYQRVNQAIYQMIPCCAPNEQQSFMLDKLDSYSVCSLQIAAVPLQHISTCLRQLVHSIEGQVSSVVSDEENLIVEIQRADGKLQKLKSKRVILALGARPKTFVLPLNYQYIDFIDPNIAFIQTQLNDYLNKNSSISNVAVIGSSHSAALAVMHLLKAGVKVKQFMNKEYKYACPRVTDEGISYTQYDNTGLKGEVAVFTKQLLDKRKRTQGKYCHQLTRYIGASRQEVSNLLEQHLEGCSHVIATIGYEPAETLLVNHLPLSQLEHDNKTSQFKPIKGLYGIGSAFPQEIKAISGEIEPAVGVGKFWTTLSDPNLLKCWQENS